MLLFWVSTKTNENFSTTKKRYYEIENTLLSKKKASLSYSLRSALHLSITSKLHFFFSVSKSPCTFNKNHIVETWIPWDITASINDRKCPLHLQCSTGTYLKVGLTFSYTSAIKYGKEKSRHKIIKSQHHITILV